MLKLNLAKRLLLSGAVTFALGGMAHAQSLEGVLGTAKNSTAQSAAAQQQVERFDDEAGDMLRDYRAALQQIDDLKLFVDRQDIFLDSQKAEITTLQSQLGTVEQVKQGIVPMMLRMVIALEDEIADDIPFRKTERDARIQRLKEILANPNVPPADQYRTVLQAYTIETTYGTQTESYQAVHPDDDDLIVNYLRYGRTGWAFMTKDESQMRYWDRTKENDDGTKGAWLDLAGIKAVDMRQAIRIAKEQAAPDLIVAPIIIAGGS